MKKTLAKSMLSLTAGALMLFSFVGTSLAAGSQYGGEQVSKCNPIYGGGQVCTQISTFTIDKQVQSGSKGGQYVDNLGANGDKFAPNQEVSYRITITNTGEETLDRVDVADTLPQYLEFVSGAGNYNKDTKVITYSISDLSAGESHEYTFIARTAGENNLPQDKGVICTLNKARAVDMNGASAEDASEICIQRALPTKDTPQVFKTTPTKTPDTGPEMLALVGLIPAAAAGHYLRRKSVK